MTCVRLITFCLTAFLIQHELCNLNGRENDERTQVDTNTNKITPGLNGA